MQKNQEKNMRPTQHEKGMHSIFFQHFFPIQHESLFFFLARFFSTRFIFQRFTFVLTCFFLISIVFHLTSLHALAEEKKISFSTETTIEKSAENSTKPRPNLQQKNNLDISTLNKKAESEKETIEKDIKLAGQNEFGWGKYFQAIGTMLFLLLILWYILKLVRRYGNGRFLPAQKLLPKDAMYIEGQLSLGPNKCITIVKILDKRLVLGITEKNITLLTEMVNNEELNLTKSFHEHVQDATDNSTSVSNNSHASTT